MMMGGLSWIEVVVGAGILSRRRERSPGLLQCAACEFQRSRTDQPSWRASDGKYSLESGEHRQLIRSGEQISLGINQYMLSGVTCSALLTTSSVLQWIPNSCSSAANIFNSSNQTFLLGHQSPYSEMPGSSNGYTSTASTQTTILTCHQTDTGCVYSSHW